MSNKQSFTRITSGLAIVAVLLFFFNNCSPMNNNIDLQAEGLEQVHQFSSKVISENATDVTNATIEPTLPKEEWVKGRILVRAKPGLSDEHVAKILSVHGGRSVEKIHGIDVHIVTLPEQVSEKAIAAILTKNPNFEFAELDQIVYPVATVNDPQYSKAWHLPKIGAPAAWDYSTGQGITIAILDTGVDGNHPDLINQMVPGWNFYDNNSNASDVYGHGTKVAGCAAAATNNAIGVASVAGSARIMPLRISAADGGASYSTMARALTWAADRSVKVANISYQSVSGSSTVHTAAQYLKDRGGITVVAAGNTGVEQTFTPSTTMISVSSTTSTDVMSSFSSYGSYVDVSAPGSSIYTTIRGGTYGSASGTSFASPITAGVVALIMSVNPNLTPTEVENILFSTAVDLGTAGYDKKYGHGRISASAAVQAAQSGISAPVPKLVIVDNINATFVGTWTISTGVTGYYGTNYQYAAIGTGLRSATWKAALVPGTYKVYARWTAHANRATNAVYTVNHTNGQNQFMVNQRLNGSQWNLLGTFMLDEASQVRLNDTDTGPVVADAIRFEPAL